MESRTPLEASGGPTALEIGPDTKAKGVRYRSWPPCSSGREVKKTVWYPYDLPASTMIVIAAVRKVRTAPQGAEIPAATRTNCGRVRRKRREASPCGEQRYKAWVLLLLLLLLLKEPVARQVSAKADPSLTLGTV